MRQPAVGSAAVIAVLLVAHLGLLGASAAVSAGLSGLCFGVLVVFQDV